MSSDSKAKILREGERYVQQGKIALAINEYLKIIKDEPDDILVLNTLGDLYLRQSKTSEANKLFMRVAEKYAANNFLHKAIAVYKKILQTDPDDLDVNLHLASLYERQGMNVDARNQYLLVGDLCAREGMTKESLDAFEKAVVIDPLNAGLQLKLAETYLEDGNKEKAYLMFAGAARAQMKNGDVSGALASFQRALALNWSSSEAMKGFLETSLNTGDLKGALIQISDSVQSYPEDPALQVLLGRVYQASGDLDRAAQSFQAAFQLDEANFPHILQLSQSYLEDGKPDRSLNCLKLIASLLICRRETDRLADAYSAILDRFPDHLETLEKYCEILSADTRDARYFESLYKLCDLYLRSGKPKDALESIEKILEIKPDDPAARQKHREIHGKVSPGIPYHPPRGIEDEVPGASHGPGELSDTASYLAQGEDAGASTVVEIDLLLNYGLKEKALQLLRGLEASSPFDKEVRQRLSSLYEETGEFRLAAEQHVLLSALHQKDGDGAAAQKSLSDARTLAPDWANAGLDVRAFASEHRIILDAARPAAAGHSPAGAMEVDLSGDLSEIFFQAGPAEGDATPSTDATPPAASDVMTEEFPLEVPKSAAPESIAEHLQEVDFYIRLGFQDEARSKLQEVAAAFPNHPELLPRYSQLGMAPATPTPVIPLPPHEPAPAAPGSSAADPGIPSGVSAEPEELTLDLSLPEDGKAPVAARSGAESSRLGADEWLDLNAEQASELPAADAGFALPREDTAALPLPAPPAPAKAEPARPAEPHAEPAPNSMFADLIAEVNSLTGQEIQAEDFETHFNLGIAYAEMGLTDDAIREFQISVKSLDASKSPREVIQCCGRLSTCYLEKGMPKSAIRWCQTALGIREISAHESIALRYDMGVAYVTAGESGQALECFGAIFGVDPGYRDVAQRMDDLKTGLDRHAP